MIPIGILGSARVAAASTAFDYLGTSSTTADLTEYAFPGVDIGAAASDRTLLVVAYARGGANTTCTGVTVAGVAATLDASSVNRVGLATIARVQLSAGTTGTVTVTYGAIRTGCIIHVYRITGGSVRCDGSGTANYGANATVPAVPALAGGWILAASYGHYNASSCTFTGTAGIIKDYDQYASGIVSRAGGRAGVPATGTYSVIAKWASEHYGVLSVASYSLT